MEYIIREELVDGSMDVGVGLVHIFVDFELIVDHLDCWREREWGIDRDEAWVGGGTNGVALMRETRAGGRTMPSHPC